MWVGRGGDGDEGGIVSGGSKHKETVFFSLIICCLSCG